MKNVGLSIIFNVEQSEYIGETTHSAGLKVVVHQPSRMAFPEDDGILVSPNALTHISVTMSKTKKMNGLYGNCTDENEPGKEPTMYQKYFNASYCEKGCLFTCLNDEIIKTCGCIDTKFPLVNKKNSTLQPCSVDNDTSTKCSKKIWEEYEKDGLPCNAGCTISCSETLYKPVISREIWPCKNYLKEMEKLNRNIYNRYNQSGQDLGQFIVFIQDFSYTSIEESPAYEVQQFSSDIGGILGLYIGFSILTIAEFAELAIDILAIVSYQVLVKIKSIVLNWKREKRIQNCNRVNPIKRFRCSVKMINMEEEEEEEEEDYQVGTLGGPRAGRECSGRKAHDKQDMTPVHI
ncbi:hypothetical protein HELRODRAFT_168369 [Helobdella robusta]|uniref:Uncharacterized protein n=1 Tax=Helobdella robusta TaxID=6412 RepID=T1F0H7_HELRO|nr:hypothetical protein HELRODRAFT_168369 [Helobdella robusta]ESO09388.1 hypothetical protein HELRODRAFT_168369 [Helobdella robusta]